jgi:GNAT superfamily N-acetyltransferase
MITAPHVIRRAVARDVPFLFRSWLRSARRDHPHIPDQVWYYQHHLILEDLWVDPTAEWLVACDTTDPSFIYGFVAAQGTNTIPMIHYVYVRSKFRRLGIGRALLGLPSTRGETVFVTETSGAGRALLADSGVAAIHNPYLLYSRTPQVGTKVTAAARKRIVDMMGPGADE